jgi:hypothetical protein
MTVPTATDARARALAPIDYRPTELGTEQLGQILVRSGFFQDTKDIAQAVVKVLAGRELGFGPIASMQGVYVVKGRVTLAANLVAAAIQRSQRFRYRVRELSAERCHLTFFERDGQAWAVLGESEFSMEDAKAAELLANQPNYKKFPRNMLFSRALTNGARWYCPEVFNGPIYTPDELGAPVDDEGNVVEGAFGRTDAGSGEVLDALPPAAAAPAKNGRRAGDPERVIKDHADPLVEDFERFRVRVLELGAAPESVPDYDLPITEGELVKLGKALRQQYDQLKPAARKLGLLDPVEAAG